MTRSTVGTAVAAAVGLGVAARRTGAALAT